MTPSAAHQECARRVAASHSSFAASFRILQPRKRQAITAFYAFCREVDDIVDECREPRIAGLKLDWWRNEVAALSSGRAQHPISIALADVSQDFDLPSELLLEIIDGMAMDLEQQRYADYKSLQLYCYRVASCVGLVCAEIFGYQDRRTLKYAHDLGLALQLTNILRDIGEDARRERIYLPQDELAAFGLDESDLLAGRNSASFQALMQFQIQRAAGLYDQAMTELPACDRASQRAGLIMAAIYRRLLERIRQQPERVLHQRLRLPGWLKFWLMLRTLAAG